MNTGKHVLTKPHKKVGVPQMKGWTEEGKGERQRQRQRQRQRHLGKGKCKALRLNTAAVINEQNATSLEQSCAGLWRGTQNVPR